MDKKEMRCNRHMITPVLAAGALSAVLIAVPVCAEQITITGEPCPLPVDGTEVPLTEFSVLGVAGDSVVIRYQTEEDAGENTEGEEGTEETSGEIVTRIGFVSSDDFLSLLPQLDLESLPNVSSSGTIGYGADQQSVMTVQQYLIHMGYLEGEADGLYGPGTAGAISSFQTDHGLAATGEGDVETVLAIIGAADGTYDTSKELNYPAQLTKEEKFASIIDNTAQNLDAFTDTSWRFSYDKFEKSGKIDSGLATGSMSVESPDMEKIQIETALTVIVTTNKKGAVTLTPALAVETTGAYRPYVQSAVFSQGNTVCENTKAVSTGGLDGALVQESTYVPLTADTLNMLAASSELDLRINGKNTKYDMHFSADSDKLTAFVEAASGLLAK